MNEFETLKNFFMWFRENGEKYLGASIEQMLEIYIEEKNKENVYKAGTITITINESSNDRYFIVKE
jgi:hypothetical protein